MTTIKDLRHTKKAFSKLEPGTVFQYGTAFFICAKSHPSNVPINLVTGEQFKNINPLTMVEVVNIRIEVTS